MARKLALSMLKPEMEERERCAAGDAKEGAWILGIQKMYTRHWFT